MIAVVALMLGFAAGCGKGSEKAGSKTGEKKVIAILLQTTTNPFFNELSDAAKSEAEGKGWEVIVVGGDNDPVKQAKQIKDFIAKKVDAMLITPVNAKAVGAPIREANEAGIPIFTADTACLDKEAKIVSHIATDNYSGGKLAGDAMVKALGGKGGKILILNYNVAQSCIDRVKGFKEVIEAHNAKATDAKIQIVAELASEAMEKPAHKATMDTLEGNRDLVGVFAINDPAALGAVAAIEEKKLQSQIKVIGFDGQPKGKRAIHRGDTARFRL